MILYSKFTQFFVRDGQLVFEQVISVDRMEHAVSLFGSFDENVRLIEQEFSVNVIS